MGISAATYKENVSVCSRSMCSEVEKDGSPITALGPEPLCAELERVSTSKVHNQATPCGALYRNVRKPQICRTSRPCETVLRWIFNSMLTAGVGHSSRHLRNPRTYR